MNKNTNYNPIIFSLTLIIGILIGNLFFNENNVNQNKFDLLLSQLEEIYVDSINKDELTEQAVQYIIEELDPHSNYIPAQDLASVNEPMEGSFDGIGIEFNLNKDTILVVAPIFYLRQSDLGTMATLLSSFPIRLFPSIVLIYLCLSSIKFGKDKISFNKTVLSVTGLLAGLNIWNNYEFALVIIVTILGLVFLLHVEDKKIKLKKLLPPSLIFITNSLIGFSIIPIFYNFRNIDLNFSYLGWWTRQFAKGFGNTRIMIPGPSMFVLSMMFVLFAIHFYFLYSYKQYPEKTAESIRKNSSTGLIISIFCILGSPYYLNRSYASGQLQIFLFFISVSFAILIGTFLTTSGSSKKYSFNSFVSLKNSLVNLFFMTLLATFVSSVLISSTPYYEYKRIASTVENPNWPDSNFSEIFEEVEEYYTINNILPNEIGYFGDFSEIVEYKTGVQSLMFITGAIDVVNFQDSFDYQKNVYKQSCDIVKQFDSELIIIDKLTYERQRLSENNFCESYYVYDSYDAIKVLKKVNN